MSRVIIITSLHRSLVLVYHDWVRIEIVVSRVCLMCLLLVCQVSIIIWRHLLMMRHIVRLGWQAILGHRLHQPVIQGTCGMSLLVLSWTITLPIDRLWESIAYRCHVETALTSRCLGMSHIELVGKGVRDGYVRLLVLLL